MTWKASLTLTVNVKLSKQAHARSSARHIDEQHGHGRASLPLGYLHRQARLTVLESGQRYSTNSELAGL